MHLPLADFLQQLPPLPGQTLLPAIQKRMAQSPQTIVVLDDDPTGTQTVYEVPVLTEWSVQKIADEFRRATPLFFILTNSRSLPASEAVTLARTIGQNLKQASQQTAREYRVISRSDSTLRGHYPQEVEALLESLAQPEMLKMIIPAFLEGGRYTFQDTHYVQEGEMLIPAGETPFARDPSFGYSASDLKAWVEEKTKGKVKAQQVHSFSLDFLRTNDAAAIAREIQALPSDTTCLVNAVARYDLENFALGLLLSQRPALCRTAASFVPAIAGLPPRPLLKATEIVQHTALGGLTVVGSYVPKSTAQLSHLLAQAPVKGIELPVEKLLEESQQKPLLSKVISDINALLSASQDVVLYTSRSLVSGQNPAESLRIGQRVSACLTTLVSQLAVRPRYFIAKGGITASDLATQALQVKKALILGQLLPGVPVWKLGPESKYPGMAYIVFPGNVGGATALTEIVTMLGSRSDR